MDYAPLLARIERFARASLAFYKKLPKSAEAQVPGVQFYKAATSAWANYGASKRAQSRPHYISKLATSVEEMDESVGWLGFMQKGDIARDQALIQEATELCAILTASLSTARTNWNEELNRKSKKPMRSSTFHPTAK